MAIRLSTNRLDLDSANLVNAEMRAWSETVNPLGNVSGATTINLALGNVVTATVTGPTTWTVTNASSTNTSSFTLVLVAGGSAAQTWMSGTVWPGGVAPSLSSAGTNVLTFFSTDAGVTWRGTLGGQTTAQSGKKLFVWGSNTEGRLGLGDTAHRSSPVQLAGTWKNFDVSGSSTGLRANGSLYVWGHGAYGPLGLGDTISRSSPVQLAGTWTGISEIHRATGSLKADGSLWVRGRSGESSTGVLGLGDTISRSSPVQLAGTWTGARLGRFNSFGLRSDGSLWAWGDGNRGALGLGHTETRSSPVQIAGTWIEFNRRANSNTPGSHGGIRPDGSLWMWGQSTVGALGLGDVADRSSPVQVPGTWRSFASSRYMTAAIRHDGTLWVWGWNAYGQLGLGDAENRSSPVQIGTGTWVSVVPGRYVTTALKTDGALFVWGRSLNGALGLGDTVTRSSPVQLPGTWSLASSGSEHQTGGLRI